MPSTQATKATVTSQWVMLIILNLLLWGTYALYHPPFDEVLTMSLFISAMMLFYRFFAYFLFERHY